MSTEPSEPNSQTDIQLLLSRLEQGNASAIQDLLEQTSGRLRVLAKRIMSDLPSVRRWEETDDLFQNASVRLWRALERLKPTAPLDYFRLAAAIMRRELIDLSRHHFGKFGLGAKHDSIAEKEGEAFPQLVAISDQTNDPVKLEMWTEFHQYVDAQNDEIRVLFDLLWYQGLTLSAASEVLGIPERTLRRKWKFARIALYQRLNHDP